jgi:hypothetical protein
MCLIDQYLVYLLHHHALFQRVVAPMTTDALVETNPEIASEKTK